MTTDKIIVMDNNKSLEGPVLHMIIEDIKQVKQSVDESARENRADHRELASSITSLERSVAEDLQEHAVDISKLQEKAKGIATVSGAIAGFVTSIIVGVIITGLKYYIGT